MAHQNIEIDLPLAKVYELMSSPLDFPRYIDSIKEVNKVNSQTFEYVTEIDGDEFRWTTNIIDDLRNTRFAWITINGNLNQTGTIRFTPLDNGSRTRVDFSLDYRTFFGAPTEGLSKFIENLSDQLKLDLQKFKKMAEKGDFVVKDEEASDSTSDKKEEITA
ncbi:MAG: SRPBCC family protein [Balneolales bacterium]